MPLPSASEDDQPQRQSVLISSEADITIKKIETGEYMTIGEVADTEMYSWEAIPVTVEIELGENVLQLIGHLKPVMSWRGGL